MRTLMVAEHEYVPLAGIKILSNVRLIRPLDDCECVGEVAENTTISQSSSDSWGRSRCPGDHDPKKRYLPGNINNEAWGKPRVSLDAV